MARDLTTAVETASQQERISTCHFLTVYLDGQTITWSDFHRDVDWNGSTYSAGGDLLGFDGLEEASDIAVSSVTVSLSGADKSIISTFLSNYYFNRRLTIHLAIFDDNDELIPDPVLLFEGRMSRPQVDEDPEQPTCVISVEASNQFSDFERKPGRHTSSNEQRAFFPDDLGFEYATEKDRTLTWGSD